MHGFSTISFLRVEDLLPKDQTLHIDLDLRVKVNHGAKVGSRLMARSYQTKSSFSVDE